GRLPGGVFLQAAACGGLPVVRTTAGASLWQDGRGQLVAEPPDAAEAGLEAGVLGAGAAGATAGVVLGAGAVARWRLDRRRIARWGREWDLVEPKWGHRTG
ncbi:hypothetical protein ABZ372_43290, partial [Streptomyces sp. NPDC005921]